MQITLDTDARLMTVRDGADVAELDLFSKAAFDRLAELWVQLGWVRKYSYGFSWLGRPIIQLPDDMVRIQEAIFQVKPDVIVETGIAHGGSLIYYASVLSMLGPDRDKGRVIGIDVEIRPHNRAAMEAHPLIDRVTMVEGGSTDPATVARVKAMIRPGETVMLILDSNHACDHVAAELSAYADIVTPGSYILVQDGVMQMVAGMPRTGADWADINPIPATMAFLEAHPEFELKKPPRLFDETEETPDCSHHPSGWLRRR